MACLPLIFVFLLCLLSFCHSFYRSLLWLSLFVILLCLCGSLGVVVVSFSLSDEYAKRKGAIPCVLSCPVVGCGLVMQNRVFRSRKIRNCLPQSLLLYIRLS